MKRTKKRVSRLPLLGMAEKEHLFREIMDACKIVGNCWVYSGDIDASGYAYKRVKGHRHPVSRIMLALATGESINLPGYEACHVPQCPHRNCCNPAHLHWGSKSENCKEREQAQRRASYTEARKYPDGSSVYDKSRDSDFYPEAKVILDYGQNDEGFIEA